MGIDGGTASLCPTVRINRHRIHTYSHFYFFLSGLNPADPIQWPDHGSSQDGKNKSGQLTPLDGIIQARHERAADIWGTSLGGFVKQSLYLFFRTHTQLSFGEGIVNSIPAYYTTCITALSRTNEIIIETVCGPNFHGSSLPLVLRFSFFLPFPFW